MDNQSNNGENNIQILTTNQKLFYEHERCGRLLDGLQQTLQQMKQIFLSTSLDDEVRKEELKKNMARFEHVSEIIRNILNEAEVILRSNEPFAEKELRTNMQAVLKHQLFIVVEEYTNFASSLKPKTEIILLVPAKKENTGCSSQNCLIFRRYILLIRLLILLILVLVSGVIYASTRS